MLRELNISNIALVDCIQLTFGSGLVALTGETGAGKSVIVGAINIVLGEKVSPGLIRAGAEKGEVSAVFDIANFPEMEKKFTEVGFDLEDDILLLKREILINGKSRCFINGRAVPLNILKYIGEDLVDIHGQHDHQSLFNIKQHLHFLDSFGELNSLASSFSAIYKEYKLCLVKQKELLAGNENENFLDFYRFQLQEIEQLAVFENELDSLDEEYDLLSKAESITEEAGKSYDELYEADTSASAFVSAVINRLKSLRIEQEEFKEIIGKLEMINNDLSEVAQSLMAYVDNIEVDNGKLTIIEDRINAINNLLRKYKKNSVADLLDFYEELKEKMESLAGVDEQLQLLDVKIKDFDKKLKKMSSELTAKRKKVALSLSQKIKEEIISLGFNNIEFEVNLSEQEIGISGKDRVEFLFSPNQGEALKALKDVASGGELSRVMLGIKVVLADKDQVPVIVFDEIDSNIGGRLGKVIGEKLKKVAIQRQVICITHLPQIASLADDHLYVSKSVINERTNIAVVKLNQQQRIEEIARMLGGNNYSEAAFKHAESLLG